MKKTTKSTDRKHHAPEEDRIPYPVIGRIVHVDKLTEIWVTFDGHDPVQARLLSIIDRAELSKKENAGREVLLMFDRGKKDHPIIVGQLENILNDMVSMKIASSDTTEERPKDALIDNERIVFDAKKEIVLKCGKGSITIKKDGKIVILGTNLISRSRGQNKIKGASVNIN